MTSIEDQSKIIQQLEEQNQQLKSEISSLKRRLPRGTMTLNQIEALHLDRYPSERTCSIM